MGDLVGVKVFVTHSPEDLDAYYARALPDLQAIARVTLNPFDRDLSTEELIEAAAGCDVIVAHRATGGDAAVFEALPDLKAFLRCAVDISTIDVAAASSHGVLVARAAKSFVASTAELALGLLLATSRHIATSVVDYRSGTEPPQRPGLQLRGQTAGIIGYGAIGSYLAGLLSAIGMEVLVADPFVDEVEAPAVRVGFGQLLAEADVVFPLAQATADTENMIGAAELAAMKAGATLINVSRGELLDEGAVRSALDSGHLRAVGLDVGRAADQRPSAALAAHPQVVATPHLGGLTPQNADAQAASSVEQVGAMIAGLIPPRSVNAEDARRLREYWSR
ncbi:MAG: NAD(P)-dependent oxidoreductase [Ilumatobacter sp.]|uniref:NAD(P)-dependent oxidoreductase n=1 Tax=Ilumatobacter sp. TaxID=1967498 RepID=UPI002A2E002B|nr:NAD(P)-dependent oxidoreductase [Ilumatobacter sp.]MDG1392550.1 NAD(P)-dependent oxidoreductase [Ilumatobacter sp.]MDG1785133.1 NAD(P)-dependent oxidoreductase [Ilumatobacter sp.]MDG2232647.1 NAD(P)-dependent oxidoreductase [Ilumatobacter sp.]